MMHLRQHSTVRAVSGFASYANLGSHNGLTVIYPPYYKQ